MIKYMVQRYGRDKISAVEVVRETKTNVWLHQTGRLPKSSKFRAFFDTWEDAHAYLIAETEREVAFLKKELDAAKSNAANVRAMENHTAHGTLAELEGEADE